MRASIEPLSAVPGPLVKELLRGYGFTPEVINWKYFDDQFNSGRERGYVWVHKGRAEGMVGLIPFSAAGPAGRRDCAWTCDWFVGASKQNPGIGVLLLKAALEREGLLVTMGGNELTTRLVPRMAALAEPEAGREWRRPLRLGGVDFFTRVQRRAPYPVVRGFCDLPLPSTRRRNPASVTLRSQSGIAEPIVELLDELPVSGWAPAYDRRHLEWHLVRCPEVVSGSALATDGVRVLAATVFWRSKADRRSWRLALWMRPGNVEAGVAAVEEAVRQMLREKAQSVSTLVGQLDADAAATLRSAGFRPTERTLPFYVLSQESPAPITGFSRLGFLDSDLGYRF